MMSFWEKRGNSIGLVVGFEWFLERICGLVGIEVPHKGFGVFEHLKSLMFTLVLEIQSCEESLCFAFYSFFGWIGLFDSSFKIMSTVSGKDEYG